MNRVDFSLIEQRASVENLIVLYIDSTRPASDQRQLAYYQPNRDGMGRRDAFSPAVLRNFQQLLKQLVENKLVRLIQNEQWPILRWLYYDFSDRYLVSHSPQLSVQQLKDTIERFARSKQLAGGETGWDRIRDLQTSLGRRSESLSVAIRKVRMRLRNTSSEVRLEDIFKPNWVIRTAGQYSDPILDWGNSLKRFVITLSELRNGRPASFTGSDPRLPMTVSVRMVDAAKRVWNDELTVDERRALENNELWRDYALPQNWEELRQRLEWGVRRCGLDTDSQSFRSFQHPGQL